MTNFNPENLTAAAKRIALSAEEKSASRARLVSYMELTPARAASAAEARATRFAGFSFLHLGRAASVLVLVGAVTLSGAGVSFAAESALPGDVLYPVKVAVNEEVRAALAPNATKKAEWEAERAERRLAETEALAETGRLDDSRRAEMEERYAKQAAKAKERADKLREMKEDGPGRADEVEARLEGAIDAHEKIIAAIAEEHPDGKVRGIASHHSEKEAAETVTSPATTSATTPMAAPAQVSTIVEESNSNEEGDDDDADSSTSRRNQESDNQDIAKKTVSKNSEASVRTAKVFENKKDGDINQVARGLEIAAQARRTNALRMIADARKFLASVSAKLGAEAVTEAEARLKAADAMIVEGDALLDAGDTKGAAAKFVAAQRTAQESRLLIKARANLKVKVKLNAAPDFRQRQGGEDKETPRVRDARRTETRGR